ncbi:MAG: hypothetical protein RL220_1296 [Bacteroidota bacterium]|jgi:XTP/dITP diphosphohydrolase
MNLIFASSNEHKIREISVKLGMTGSIRGLASVGCTEEIPETGSTLNENAFLKASFVVKNYMVPCFADDTGLEVEALNNAPGVHSARYAGEQRNSADNIAKLLDEMKHVANRRARFRTVICMCSNGEVHYFEGIVHGHIARETRGTAGFGYDSVFVPDGSSRTFAEMSLEEKNLISHRAIAFSKLKDYLSKSRV